MSRIARWSWPPGFALVQFPNPPLITALLASGAAHLTGGQGNRAFTAIFYAALSVWAYEEALHGANWFRRAIGVGFAAYVIVSLADALHSG